MQCVALLMTQDVFGRTLGALTGEGTSKTIFAAMDGVAALGELVFHWDYLAITCLLWQHYMGFSLRSWLRKIQVWDPLTGLLANLVELGSLQKERLAGQLLDFTNVVTRIVGKCGSYVLPQRSQTSHWHPVLGWFAQPLDQG